MSRHWSEHNGEWRPLDLFVTAGQVSDYICALELINGLPKVEWLLGELPFERHWSERQWRRLRRRMVP